MLLNPICIAGFAFASWRFFRDRIPFEEQGLEQFFGTAYVTYKAKTPTCTPPTHPAWTVTALFLTLSSDIPLIK